MAQQSGASVIGLYRRPDGAMGSPADTTRPRRGVGWGGTNPFPEVWLASPPLYRARWTCPVRTRHRLDDERHIVTSSLAEVAQTQLAVAQRAANGRASATVYGGHEHALRQTVIALTGGQELAEHESPGEATVQVLHGRVEMRAGDDVWTGSTGDLLVVPAIRHSLAAVDDSVVLLTVVKQV